MRCTVLLGFRTMMKLSHCLPICLSLVVLVFVVSVVFLTLSNGSCGAYITCLGGALYGFASSLTFMQKVPLKHAIPVKKIAKLIIYF